MSSFSDLCEVADHHGLTVEIVKNDQGTAIWVFDDQLPEDFRVAGVEATLRSALVASPFWDVGFDAAAPQLISMLADRGYA